MSAYTDIEFRSNLITTLIFPLFDYCAALYGDLTGILDTKLQTALNSCVRYVFGLGCREHITPYRHQLGWLTARNRRLYLSSRLLHKTLITSSPPYLSDLFEFHEPIHPSRREGPQIKIQFTFSQQLMDSFSVHTAKFWNSLPASMRMADTVSRHKDQLKEYLLESELSQASSLFTP